MQKSEPLRDKFRCLERTVNSHVRDAVCSFHSLINFTQNSRPQLHVSQPRFTFSAVALVSIRMPHNASFASPRTQIKMLMEKISSPSQIAFFFRSRKLSVVLAGWLVLFAFYSWMSARRNM
jgi:hypothetical protein